MSKHYLITGGAGFIGSHLADRLHESGHTITVLDDLSTGEKSNISHRMGLPNFHFHEGTVLDETLVTHLIKSVDEVVHLAAVVGVRLIADTPVDTLVVNIQGTDVVLRSAAKQAKKVLLASTSEVYGKSQEIPFNEEADPVLGPSNSPRWGYAISKLADEHLAMAYRQQYGLPVVIARLFNTVGSRQSGDYGMVFPRFIQQALSGEALTVYGDGQQTRCFISVHDTSQALQCLASKQESDGGIFNIGSESDVTIEYLAKRIILLLSSTSRIQNVPFESVYPKGFEDIYLRKPDTQKLRTLCTWEPHYGLDSMILEVADWYRSR